MPKRGQGEGTITKLPNGSYQGRLTVGYDDNGKQKRKAFYGKTKREVQEKMNEAKAAQDKGVYMEPSKMTVSEWLSIWLTEYKKRSVRPSTYSNLYNCIKVHIEPMIGKIKLKDLRAEMIQKLINSLNDKGLARASINVVHSCLYGALEQAVDNELITKNVATKTMLPKADKKEICVLSTEEQERFIKAAQNDSNGDLFILMLATGLRIGEATALMWDDIDFETGTLTVNKTITRYFDCDAEIKSRRELNPPKTKSGNRTIPLLPGVLKMLKEKKKYDFPNEKNLLFASIRGELLPHCTVRSRFKKLLKDANIDNGVHVHALRHTFATRGLEQGIELKVMQELLGHASITMTADVYSHVLPNKKKDSIMKLEDTIKL